MACRGLSAACLALATPVTGGNVSLYNETRLPDGTMQPIHPTPVVGMVGLVHDLDHVTGLAWREAGDAIWLLGVSPEAGGSPADGRVGLAASSYLQVIHAALTGRPPLVDFDLEVSVQALVREAIAAGLVASAHDLSDGGLAVAAAEACIASGLGAYLELPAGEARLDRLLFAEGGARVLVSVSPAADAAWQERLAAAGSAVPATCLGVVQPESTFTVAQAGVVLLEQPLALLQERFEGAIPRRLRQAAPPPER
jgi:phosphoribosylformylglycinamidine synthase